MTLIYVDPTALMLPPYVEPASAAEDVIAPGAPEALGHLVDGGFDVVVLGPSMEIAGMPAGVRYAAELPDHLDADDWYLTGEPHPAYGRPRGGTTVLVGPHRPEGKLPLPRFDMETRDLAATAMEILTREAMA